MVASSLRLVLVGCLCLMDVEGKTAAEKGKCRQDAQGTMKSCLGSAAKGKTGKAAMDKCKTDFAATAKDSCGATTKDIDRDKAKTAQEAANKFKSDCKLLKTAGCEAELEKMTGHKRPTDATLALNEEKLEEKRGEKNAMKDELSKCGLEDAACIETMRQKFATSKGGTYSDADFKHVQKGAANEAGAAAVATCAQAATTRANKQKCLKSDAAKEAFAKVSGKKTADVTEADLKNAGRKKAGQEARSIMSACTTTASTDADKLKCSKDSLADIKRTIANSKGELAANVKDSEAFKALSRGESEDAVNAATTCKKDADADRKKCKDNLKTVMANARGKKAADISDHEVKKGVREGMIASIADRMDSCMEAAGATANDTEIADCKASIKTLMKEGDFEGNKDPSKAKMRGFLKEAAQKKTAEVFKDCTGQRTACLASAKDKMAKTMGRSKGDIKDSEVERENQKAAYDAVGESMRACAQAKKDSAAATCEDLVGKYVAARGKAKPTDAKKLKALESRVKKEAVVNEVKKGRMVCFEAADKAKADACIASLDADVADTFKQAFAGLPEKKRKLAEKTVKNEADRGALTDQWEDCVNSAANAADKAACRTALIANKAKTGVKNDVDSLIKMHHGNKLADTMLACADASASKKTCRADARKASMDTGMKKSEWGLVRKTGAIEAAAKAYQTCNMTDTNTEADCVAEAKEAWQAVKGAKADDTAAWDNVKGKVKQIGAAKRDGKPIKMVNKKNIEVDVETSATACAEKLKTAFLEKLKAVLAAGPIGNTTYTGAQKRGTGCGVVDDKAEVSGEVPAAGATDTTIQTDAVALATKLEGETISAARRLSGSHTLVAVYAAQGAELCPEDDATCGTAAATTNAARATVSHALKGAGNAAVSIALSLAAFVAAQ